MVGRTFSLKEEAVSTVFVYRYMHRVGKDVYITIETTQETMCKKWEDEATPV